MVTSSNKENKIFLLRVIALKNNNRRKNAIKGARAAARKTKTEREITACLAVAAAAVPLFSCHRRPLVHTLASSLNCLEFILMSTNSTSQLIIVFYCY